MGTIRQFGTTRRLPSGRYQLRYRRLGRLVPAEKTFATKADANLYLSQVESDLHRGTFVDPAGGRVLDRLREYGQAHLVGHGRGARWVLGPADTPLSLDPQ